MAAATLAVRVSAQIAEFQKSFKDLTNTTEKFHDDFKKVASNLEKATGFAGLSKQALAIGAAFTVAVGAMQAIGAAAEFALGAVRSLVSSFVGAVRSTIELGDTLFSLSQKTSLSVESLSALRFIAGQTNTSLETITGAVFKMQTTLGKGGDATAAAINKLGLSLKDLRTADPSDAFKRILTSLGDIPNATQRAAIGAQIFGRQFKEIAQLTQEDLAALAQKARDLGVVMSTETAVAADRFSDAIGELRARAEGFALRIGAAVLPALIAFVETATNSFDRIVRAAGISSAGLGAAFDSAVVQIGQSAARLIEIIANVVDAVTPFFAGQFIKHLGLLDIFLEIEQQSIRVGRALDLAFNFGAFSKQFDALDRAVQKVRDFGEGTAKATLTAGAALRRLSQAAAQVASEVGGSFGASFARIKTEIDRAAADMRKGLASGVGAGVDEVSQSFEKLRDKIRGVEILETAKDWAQALQEPQNVVFTFADKTLTKEFAGALDDVVDRFGSLKAAGLDALNGLHKAAKGTLETLKTIPTALIATINPNFDEHGRPRVINGPPTSLPGATGILPHGLAEQTVKPFRTAFEGFARELPQIMASALQGGNNVFVAAAAGLAVQFSSIFNQALERVFKQGGKLSLGEKAAGVLGVGLQSLVTGLQLGQGTTSLLKGGLAGLGSGALSGLPLAAQTGGASILVGAGVGLVGGLIGAAQGKRQERFAVQQAKDAFVAQFGGLEKLRELAQKAGFSLDTVFNAKKPEQLQQAITAVNSSLAAYNKHLEGLQTALAGVNKRAEIFAANFTELIAKRDEFTRGGDTEGLANVNAKIAEVAQRTQPEFERLGLFVRDTFVGLVRESGDAFGAIVSLAPAFSVLKAGVTDFGLTSTATIDELLKSFDLINSEVFGPLLQNVQSSGQILKGLFDAKALSPAGFQAIAADIGQSLQEIANKGGDITQALALSQPILQTLYEAQQRFGAITDQTTQSILRQAEEQGLVGEHMKSVNDKILDVLVSIAEVFGAVLPESIKKTKTAAEEAASDVENAFKQIDIAPIDIPFDFRLPDFNNELFRERDGIPAFGRGGIVTEPTLALIGEDGPEAVVPLTGHGLQLSRGAGGLGPTTLEQHITIQAWDGADVERVYNDRIIPLTRRALQNDQGGLRTTVERITS